MVIDWRHPDIDIVVEIYYEKGSRDEPPCAQVEGVYDGTSGKNVTRLFNPEELESDFWNHRPDLEGNYNA